MQGFPKKILFLFSIEMFARFSWLDKSDFLKHGFVKVSVVEALGQAVALGQALGVLWCNGHWQPRECPHQNLRPMLELFLVVFLYKQQNTNITMLSAHM